MRTLRIWLWMGMGVFLLWSPLQARPPVQLSLIQIQATGRLKGDEKPKVDPTLRKKAYVRLLKKLLEDYFYQNYLFLALSNYKAKWKERVKFVLTNGKILYITPLKAKKKGWLLLKVEIYEPNKKDKKKKLKPILVLVQKIRNGALFLVRLKEKKGALFLAIRGQILVNPNK